MKWIVISSGGVPLRIYLRVWYFKFSYIYYNFRNFIVINDIKRPYE